MVDLDFSEKGVLITGAVSGIGRATVDLFVEKGARVAISDINEEKTRQFALELGNKHVAAPGDVSKESSVAEIFNAAKVGLGKVDVLINCAGVSDSVLPTLEQDVEHWQKIIDINLTGTYLTCRAVAPDMLKNGSGAIVNISSIAGLVGLPYRNAYTASKHGVAGITKSLAGEWGQCGIRVNAVSPGYVLTPMVQQLIDTGKLDPKVIQRRTPAGRLASPEEIANVMMFLASELASYINGAIIPVDGGYTAYGAAGPAVDVE
jgi:NAD(P)-dependent dehydrogenase (short-subunit alcohol dehydrogenase family)